MTTSSQTWGVNRHRGFTRLFGGDGLTLGLFFAIESYPGAVPTMAGQVELARRAEQLGFAALWVRDVPLLDPSFGDAGQVFDPWVYLGHICGATSEITLATGGIVLPLHHPLHVAKAAASVDVLSGGRFVLGVAGGDRPVEYPAFGVRHTDRSEVFQESVAFLRTALRDSYPTVTSPLGSLRGDVDVIPKPVAGDLPLLAIGAAGQALPWISSHMDGFVTYPRPPHVQRQLADAWGREKPIAQSLYVDVVADPDREPTPIHLGYRLGTRALLALLLELHDLGMGHVILNLKYGSRPAGEVLEDIGRDVIPRLR